MFNSFLSKFKTLFGSPAATPPEPNTPVIPVSPAEAPAAVGADKSNRVVFVAKKTAKKARRYPPQFPQQREPNPPHLFTPHRQSMSKSRPPRRPKLLSTTPADSKPPRRLKKPKSFKG